MLKRFSKIAFRVMFTAILFTSSVPAFAAGSKLDEILPPSVLPSTDGHQALPSGDLKLDIVPQAISILLGLAATVSFVVFVYAGIMLIIAQGNEEEVTKFKNILIWSLVGLLAITISYAIVRGIMQLSFT